MKTRRTMGCILAILCLLCTAVPALAAQRAEDGARGGYRLVVSGTRLDLSGLPRQPYYEGEHLMVPLRKIGQALGYRVDWDAGTGAITLDDGYIQRATLYDGTAQAVFEGRLKVINMSRTVENPVKTVVWDGCTYVPLEFFCEFMNDAGIEGDVITVEPSRCELAG